jgi:hypothetical protein
MLGLGLSLMHNSGRFSKNLLNFTTSLYAKSNSTWITNGDSSITLAGTVNSYSSINLNGTQQLKPNTTYTFSVDYITSISALYTQANLGKTNNVDDISFGALTIQSTIRTTATKTFTTDSTGLFHLGIYLNSNTQAANTITIYHIQLELGSSATAWEQY